MKYKIAVLNILVLQVIISDLKIVNCQTATPAQADTSTAATPTTTTPTTTTPESANTTPTVDPNICKNLRYFAAGPAIPEVLSQCKINYNGTEIDYNKCCDKTTQKKLHDWW